MEKLIVKTSISITADKKKVWEVITSPAQIKKYLMGTNVSSDWKVGGAITYEGEYQGKKYRDKGIIKKIEPGKVFESTYWSSMSGKADQPENYNLVTYKLSTRAGKTVVTLIQDNVKSADEKKHLTDNWKMVLKGLKKVAEE